MRAAAPPKRLVARAADGRGTGRSTGMDGYVVFGLAHALGDDARLAVRTSMPGDFAHFMIGALGGIVHDRHECIGATRATMGRHHRRSRGHFGCLRCFGESHEPLGPFFARGRADQGYSGSGNDQDCADSGR